MRTLFRVLPLIAAWLVAVPVAAQGYHAMPVPPAGAAPGQRIPPRTADGGYETPNIRLSDEEATWHVRAALNVAALGCRDAEERATVAAYNRLLFVRRSELATVDAAVRAQYQQRHGAAWQDQHDATMTRLYNFFAQPPAQNDFCRVAKAALRMAHTVPAPQFPQWARATLIELEAPFLNFYRRYDAYRIELAAWRSGEGPAAPGARPAHPAMSREQVMIAFGLQP